MSREWLSLSLLVAVMLLMSGCRRAVPPSFSPGPEVVELTTELEAEAAEAAENPDSEEDAEDDDVDEEDAEEETDELSELEIYQALQSQIGTELAQRTGTPAKMILLGEEEHSKLLHQGYEVYARYCTQCHGVNGDGNGPIAIQLDPKPRNYTHGVFKFTSTPYGGKPRHADLVLTVRRGVTGTSMPSFDRLSDDDVDAVVEYVLALTYRGQFERELASYAFDDEELPDEEGMDELIAEILEPWYAAANQLVMPVTPMPPMTAETIKAGHEIFLKNACNKCHGKFGRGGSMGGVDVGKDAWGNSAAAADLSSGMFHGGDRPIDIYRRIYSGINGTPMPAFKSMFEENPEVIWQLVHFIKETGNRRRLGLPPLSEADMPTDSPAIEATAIDEEADEELVADEDETADEESEDVASEEAAEIDEAEVDTVIETEDEAKEATETESEVEVEVEAAISSAA